MTDFDKGDGTESAQLCQYRWKGASSITLAHQLNQQFIELCCELFGGGASGTPFPAIASYRDLWTRLTPTARIRLSLFPFVIVDFRFADAMWWREATNKSTRARGHVSDPTAATSRDWFALETLMFAWQVAREDQCVASMLFAMPPPVAAHIASLTMQKVRMLAVESAGNIRLRWDNDLRFWRELLVAALEPDDAALAALRREAKLRFCGELIQAHSFSDAQLPMIAESRMYVAQEHEH